MSDLWGMGGANNAIGLDHQDNVQLRWSLRLWMTLIFKS